MEFIYNEEIEDIEEEDDYSSSNVGNGYIDYSQVYPPKKKKKKNSYNTKVIDEWSFADSQLLSRQYHVSELDVPIATYLSSVVNDGWNRSFLVSGYNSLDLERKRSNGSPYLSREEQKAILVGEGLHGEIEYNDRQTRESLDLLMKWKKDELYRSEIRARAPDSFAFLGVPLELGMDLLDPANIALAYIMPQMAAARMTARLATKTSRLSRAATRFGAGVVDGAIGNIPFEGLQAAFAHHQQEDYTTTNFLTNIAFGAAAGGVLQSSIGHLIDIHTKNQAQGHMRLDAQYVADMWSLRDMETRVAKNSPEAHALSRVNQHLSSIDDEIARTTELQGLLHKYRTGEKSAHQGVLKDIDTLLGMEHPEQGIFKQVAEALEENPRQIHLAEAYMKMDFNERYDLLRTAYSQFIDNKPLDMEKLILKDYAGYKDALLQQMDTEQKEIQKVLQSLDKKENPKSLLAEENIDVQLQSLNDTYNKIDPQHGERKSILEKNIQEFQQQRAALDLPTLEKVLNRLIDCEL